MSAPRGIHPLMLSLDLKNKRIIVRGEAPEHVNHALGYTRNRVKRGAGAREASVRIYA
jgi:hypothetical protein